MDSSPALEERIRQLANNLETIFDRIIRVDVAVEAPHRSGRKGERYHVRVLVEVPGKDVVISRDPGPDGAHEDAYVAVRDSFRAAERRLRQHVAKNLRREVKSHEEPAHGRVSYLDVELVWGYLEASDGRRIYFHQNSVIGGIQSLELGDEVRFEEEPGAEGPQATSVTPVGTHGRHELPPDEAPPRLA